MRFMMLVVGPLMIIRARRGLSVTFNRRADLWGGLAACMPTDDRNLTGRYAWVVAGGPLASLLLAAAAITLGWPGEGRLGGWLVLAGFVSLLIFAVTIPPFKSGGFRSDGRQLLDLARGDPTVAARMSAMALMARSFAGVRPRDLDRGSIDLLAASTDCTLRLAGLQLAAVAAMDRGEDASAHVEGIARDWQAYPQGFRHELAAVVAVWKAGPGNDRAGADAWMAEVRKGSDMGGWVLLAEAAVAAGGDRTAFDAALARARAKVAKLHDAGLAAFMADRLDGLERQMAGGSA